MKKVILFCIILIVAWGAASFTRGMFAAKGSPMEGLIITGHRGGAGLGEENSIECIRRGMQAGAESIEIDVHITSDNEIVVCHDPSLDRTTTGTGAINDLTLEQILQVSLKDSLGNATAQKIPTLKQVLDTINGETELLLEIKRKNGNNKGIEERVLEILKENNTLGYTTIQSFDDSVLEKLHSLDPSLKLEKLLFGKIIGLPVIFDGTFKKFSTEKYSYIRSFNFFHMALGKNLSEYLHKNGYRTRIWTFDTPEETPQIKLDGIITDRPDLF